MKLVVAFLFRIIPSLVYVGDWALRWTEGNEQLQIFFVMLFFPVIMNALQYYIIDGFIKGEKGHDHESLVQDEREASEEERLHAHAWDTSFASDDEGEALVTPKVEGSTGDKHDKHHGEYNPDQDGERSTSSQEREERRLRKQA